MRTGVCQGDKTCGDIELVASIDEARHEAINE